MRADLKTLIAVAFLFLIFAGCINQKNETVAKTESNTYKNESNEFANQQNETPVKIESNNYENKDYGFAFNYPINWEKTNALGSIVSFQEPDSNNIWLPTGIQVLQQPKYVDISLKELAHSVDKSFTKEKDYQLISEGSFNLNGAEAYQQVFDIPLLGINVRYSYTYYYRNNAVFLIVLKSEKTKYNNHKSEFDSILNSFKVK